MGLRLAAVLCFAAAVLAALTAMATVHCSCSRKRSFARLLTVCLSLGKWLDGMETSLLYCKRHSIDPDTEQAKFVRRLRKAAAPGQARGQVSYADSAWCVWKVSLRTA